MTRNLKLFGVLLAAMVGLGLFVVGANVPPPEEANINWRQFEGGFINASCCAIMSATAGKGRGQCALTSSPS